MAPESLDFQLLFEALPAPHLVLTPALQVAALNEAMCQLLAQPREAVVGQPALAVLPTHTKSPELDRWQAALQQVVREQTTSRLDALRYELPGQAPATRYAQVLLKPVLTPAGELRYILVRVLDVTAQVQAEQQVQLSHENFSTLARTSHDVLWELDLRTGQLWHNEMFTIVFGYPRTPEYQTSAFWYSCLHPDDRPQINAAMLDMRTGQATDYQLSYRLRRADGSWAEAVDRFHIIRDEEGRGIRALGAVQDATQARATERALHYSLEQFQVLADFIPQLVWVLAPGGQSLYTNQRWIDYTGLPSFHDAEWPALVHPQDRPRAIARWQQAQQTGSNYQCDYRLRSQEGQYRWFLAQARPVLDEAGQVTKWFGTCTDIEAQKQTQQLLEQKDHELQLILGKVPAFIATLLGPQHIVGFINQHFSNLLGGQVRVGQMARQAATMLAGQGLFELLDEAYTSGQTLVEQERGVWVGPAEAQQQRYFDFTIQPLLDAAGHPQGILVFAVEVTERVQARLRLDDLNQELRRQDEILRVMTESLPQITSITLPNGSMEYLSPHWFEYTGQTIDDLPRCWSLALHPDDTAIARQAFEQAIATASPFSVEVRLRRHDGQYRWHLSRSVPSFTVDGQLQCFYGACADVQDQRLLAEELRRSEQQFRFLAESVPAIVWTARPDGGIDYLNSRWTHYTGIAVEQSLQEGWTGLLWPAEQETVHSEFSYSIRTGTELDMESRLLNVRTGQYRWFLHRASPLRDEYGQIQRWFGTTTDIDDYKQVQQRLEEKNAELTRTNQDLDSFVYAVSHDLKQPIHNMAGIFQELIRTAFFRDPDAMKLITMFEKSLHQIDGTIHNLTELVRLQKLRHEQPAEPLNLAQLTEEVLLSIQEQVTSSRALIEVDFAAVPVLLFVRPHLQSVLYNLLSNALKYAAPHRRPRIVLRTLLLEGHPVLEVQDNGLGLDLQRFGGELFQLFRRFHDHVEGAGLGLYLVNRVVQNVGGHIAVDSTVGEGTTFRVSLPASTLPAL
ncbi:PAS domain S-box-containing protein [Hymenobacter luteus]|uniref:histidine kinase n=2 Tax=Hymenobacter TaxID=89966 RepID=A0A7W9WB10_9BACT|nr:MULTISPECIES: PAS domain-containing protein [Hymenobacter]MBB4599785.1 PAS domain S-box-containing protein [Hymenobacter latericoloratus]MBB6057905.1 PAS domain S-box-containing protein [Hymenobacter luteus]